MQTECLKSDDGAAVLIFRYTASARTFYAPAAEAFRNAVREKLYPAAMADYAASDDRRKRYRFLPWTAEFHAADDGDGTALLIAVNGEILRHERHYFDGEVLVKREQI